MDLVVLTTLVCQCVVLWLAFTYTEDSGKLTLLAVGVGLVLMFLQSIEKKRKKQSKLIRRLQSQLYELRVQDGVVRSRDTAWFNVVIGKMWRKYSSGLAEWFASTLQPTLDWYKPETLSHFRVSDVKIGDQSPVIESMSIHNTSDDSVVVDLEVGFAGKGHVVLSIGVKGINIPIEIFEVTVQCHLRAHSSMIERWPWCGTLSLSFLERPKVDFHLKPLKSFDLMEVPWVSKWIKETTAEAIDMYMLWPNKYDLPFDEWWNAFEEDMEEEQETEETKQKDRSFVSAFKRTLMNKFHKRVSLVDLTRRELYGILHLRLIRAVGLPYGRGRPFCVLSLDHQVFKSNAQKKKKVSPTWNEIFEFELETSSPPPLSFTVVGRKTVKANTVIGRSSIQIDHFASDAREHWIYIHDEGGKPSGRLLVEGWVETKVNSSGERRRVTLSHVIQMNLELNLQSISTTSDGRTFVCEFEVDGVSVTSTPSRVDADGMPSWTGGSNLKLRVHQPRDKRVIVNVYTVDEDSEGVPHRPLFATGGFLLESLELSSTIFLAVDVETAKPQSDSADRLCVNVEVKATAHSLDGLTSFKLPSDLFPMDFVGHGGETEEVPEGQKGSVFATDGRRGSLPTAYLSPHHSALSGTPSGVVGRTDVAIPAMMRPTMRPKSLPAASSPTRPPLENPSAPLERPQCFDDDSATTHSPAGTSPSLLKHSPPSRPSSPSQVKKTVRIDDTPSLKSPPEWKDDNSSRNCSKCAAEFGFFLRRHHCRGCGELVCSHCSNWRISLPCFAEGTLQRVCQTCYDATMAIVPTA